MKSLILALTLALSTSAFATKYTGDQYKCFLDEVAYTKSPIVTVNVDNKTKVLSLQFTESPSDWKVILNVKVSDNTEDVLALYENEKKGVALSFYLDESDSLGLMEGNIKSPVMNGSVKCLPVL